MRTKAVEKSFDFEDVHHGEPYIRFKREHRFFFRALDFSLSLPAKFWHWSNRPYDHEMVVIAWSGENLEAPRKFGRVSECSRSSQWIPVRT